MQTRHVSFCPSVNAWAFPRLSYCERCRSEHGAGIASFEYGPRSGTPDHVTALFTLSRPLLVVFRGGRAQSQRHQP